MSKLSDIEVLLKKYKENIDQVSKEELLDVLIELQNYCGTLQSQCINLLQIRDKSKLEAVAQRPFSWESLRRDDSPFKALSLYTSQ